MKRKQVSSLYYITHKDNVKSIWQHGILSHQSMAANSAIKAKKIYNEDVVNRRKAKQLPNGHSLMGYANLYFQPRNPMLYAVLLSRGNGNFAKGSEDIVLLEIKKDILAINQPKFVATANAATHQAEFYSNPSEGLKRLDKIILDNYAWWKSVEHGKEKIMAEFLVKDVIPSNYIMSIYTASKAVRVDLEKQQLGKVNIVLGEGRFFLPNRVIPLNPTLIKLVEGDMFFSTAQTLTISVNTVGIMGKGLASRTRYQFPDVYVEYQDACRSKKIQMEKPYLIKREKSVDELFADESSLPSQNNFKWFLLFPTKSHWRNDSDFAGIEKGLQWLVKNYHNEGITSIALPALGCGLGRLSWADVGRLMCRYLSQMKIRSFVYLPMKQKIPESELTADFLLA